MIIVPRSERQITDSNTGGALVSCSERKISLRMGFNESCLYFVLYITLFLCMDRDWKGTFYSFSSWNTTWWAFVSWRMYRCLGLFQELFLISHCLGDSCSKSDSFLGVFTTVIGILSSYSQCWYDDYEVLAVTQNFKISLKPRLLW